VLHRVRSSLARRLRGEQTSASDTSAYTDFCARAARDEETFATFKRAPVYTTVLEHVTCEQGAAYLEHALRQSPDFEAWFDRFRENDTLGAPRTCDYGPYGRFSPTTLRYINVLSDLRELFGDLGGLRVLEIGGGYGGQCFIASAMFPLGSWTIVDLGPCRALQRVYLDRMSVPNVRFVSPERLTGLETSYDLVISNYAFSECKRPVQNLYLEHALRRAVRGYLTCNWVSPPEYDALSREELLAAVPRSQFLPEVLHVPVDIGIWVWGDRHPAD
jgi:putative sugar O-methyltransferase